jgi:hypothetical protein
MSTVTLPAVVLRGKAIIATVHQYSLNKAKAAALDEANKLLKDEILEAMGDELVASAGAHIVRITEVMGTQGTPNRVITKEMIGQVIAGTKGRAGSTRLEVI